MTRLRLFGHPAIQSPDGSEPLRLPPKAVVMTALIAAAERPLARDWLAQKLWPDAELAHALGNLRRKLHEALEVLGRDTFTTTRQTVQWNRDSATEVDVVRFDTLRQTDPIAALGSYGGDLCAGLDDEALDDARRLYRSRYEDVLRSSLTAARAMHDGTALRKCLIAAIAFDPFDERAVRELMSLEAASGNRSAALREYTAFCHRLRGELGVDPHPETTALFAQIAQERHDGATFPVTATTSFVGREHELKQIDAALHEARVVTLIGPGGIGKTRLAARCANQFASAYAGGVWFVDLENANAEHEVWERIAQACRIEARSDAQAAVLRFCSARDALFVLDTCEHVPDAARRVSETMAGSTGVHLLTTSRRRLRIAGSREIEITPLEIPPEHLVAGDSALRYPAYRLFVERAALADPGFRISPDDLPVLHHLLHNIDGLPLAIELVASRVSVLSIRALHSRLAQSLRATRSTRSRRGETLHATLAWSYELLDDAARDLFTRLSIFQGTFTLEDAEDVAADRTSAIELLLHLADASLISLVPQSESSRYRLLETTRDFAHGLLQQRDVYLDVIRAHAECFARKADTLAKTPDGRFAAILDDVLRAMPDFTLAMRHAAERAWGEIGVRLMEGLYRFGLRHHARAQIAACGLAFYDNHAIDPPSRMRIARLTTTLLESAESAPLYEAIISYYRSTGENERLADALNGFAAARFYQTRYDESERLLLEARDRLEGTKDRRLLLKTLIRLGALYNDYERTAATLSAAAEELIALGELRQAAQALKNVAASAYFVRRYEETVEVARRAIELASATSELAIQSNLLSMCGCALMEMGDVPAAARAHLEANALMAGLGECVEVAETLQDAAMTLTAVGIFEESAHAIGFAERLRETLGAPLNPRERTPYDETVEELQRVLGERYEAIAAAGARERAESVEALVSSALRRLLDGSCHVLPRFRPHRQ